MFVECFLTQDAKAEEAALKEIRKVDSEVFQDAQEQPDWSDPMEEASPTEVASDSSQDLAVANEEPTIVPKEEPTVIPEKTEEKPEKTPAAAEQKPDPEKKKTAEAEPCSLCPVAVHSETSLDHTKAGTSF